jgi:hypothetical protein
MTPDSPQSGLESTMSARPVRHQVSAAALSAVLALSAALTFPSGSFAGDEVSAPPSKDSLTPERAAALHRLIRRQPGEYKWDAVPWYASVWHARKAAAEEDKPIFVFGTGGAGFNDPLGNC